MMKKGLMDRKQLLLTYIPACCRYREQTADLLLFLINPEGSVYIRIPAKKRVLNFLQVYVPELPEHVMTAIAETLDAFYAQAKAARFFNANRLCYALETPAQREYRQAKYTQFNTQRYDVVKSASLYQQAQAMRKALKAPQQHKRDYLQNTMERQRFANVFLASFGDGF